MSGYFDTRYLLQLADQAPMECDHLTLGVISRFGDSNPELKDPSDPKSWIDGSQSEKAAQQQTRAQQQRHTESYLRNYQHAAQSAAGVTGMRALLPGEQGRHKTEYQGCDNQSD